MITTGTEGIDATEAACWYTTIWGEWGIYPYQQRVDDNTYWCGRGGILTYRNTYPTLGDTLCNHGDGASAAASAPPTCSSKSGDGVDLGSKYPRPLWQQDFGISQRSSRICPRCAIWTRTPRVPSARSWSAAVSPMFCFRAYSFCRHDLFSLVKLRHDGRDVIVTPIEGRWRVEFGDRTVEGLHLEHVIADAIGVDSQNAISTVRTLMDEYLESSTAGESSSRGASKVSDRFLRQARNEALFREVNERIAELGENAQSWSPDGIVEFLCECGQDGGCGERVAIPFLEYERVRRQDDRFVVLPGHENPEIERVVSSTDSYVIVDKTRAVEPLVADDPRGAPSS